MKFVGYAIGAAIAFVTHEYIGWLLALILGAIVGGFLATVLTATSEEKKEKHIQNPSPSDSCWEQALAEFDGGQKKAATWAKALAASNGNDGAAKAEYLKLRADELAKAEHDSQLRDAQAAQLQRIRSLSGTCPNCGSQVRLNSERCNNCNSAFLGEYKPRPLDSNPT